MTSSCAVVTGPPTVTALVSTATVLATRVSTLTTSNCLLPTILGQLALCRTYTSSAPVETVVPGLVVQITSTGQSLVTIVQTLPGVTSTVCQAVPTTPPPSSSTSSTLTTTTIPRTTTTTPPVLVPSSSATISSVPSPSAVAPSTPTSDSILSPDPSSSSPSIVDVVSPTSSHTPTPSTPPSTATETIAGPRRSTSYITSYVTVVDSSGQTLTSASTIPTLLNIPGSNTSRASPGAVAGGTVGGIAALALAAFCLWMMRKRGYFRRGDGQIEEDAWDPAGHGDYFAAGGGRGGGSRRSAAGMAGVGPGGRSSPGNSSDEKHDPLSEKDREIDAATLERHKSWYHRSLASHGDELDLEEAYGGKVGQPAAFTYLPTTNEVLDRRASTYAAAPAAPPRRSMSTAMSDASRSSHSHESYPSRHPSMDADRRMSHPSQRPSLDADRRMSLATPLQYSYFQSFSPPAASYVDERSSYASRSPPLPHAPMPPIARPKSASPPTLQLQHSPYPTVSRQRSLPGLQGHLPIHMRSASLGGRPTLGAIQARRPSTHSRTVTSDSMSTISTPQSHYMSPLTSSASESTLISTLPSTPSTSLAHDKSALLPTPSHPVLPNIERLRVEHPKRPSMDRNTSSDSIFLPSQWLGARVVNADDSRSTTTATDTDTETIASNILAGESSDSLAAATEMISRAHVRIDGAR